MHKSYEVLAEGGMDMWDKAKADSKAIVKVVTDDTEISLGHLLDRGPRGIKVAVYTPTRQSLETQETGRRHRTQILGIDSRRITTLRVLN